METEIVYASTLRRMRGGIRSHVFLSRSFCCRCEFVKVFLNYFLGPKQCTLLLDKYLQKDLEKIYPWQVFTPCFMFDLFSSISSEKLESIFNDDIWMRRTFCGLTDAICKSIYFKLVG